MYMQFILECSILLVYVPLRGMLMCCTNGKEVMEFVIGDFYLNPEAKVAICGLQNNYLIQQILLSRKWK